jgi:aspartyl-tRNA(Asn)/glutamyl-tRNA(Gln) amidotransferase subunit B
MRSIHTLVRYLGISDGNMQEGSFRCDANVSVRPKGDPELGTRTEIKNLNSFRFIEKAIEYEIERQIDLVEDGRAVVQETRLFDADRGVTRPMRTKEEANDYRYFPDPDLLPIELDDAFVEAMRQTLPELPQARRRRFLEEFDLRPADADILTLSPALADYFEETAGKTKAGARMAANWILGELSAVLNREAVEIERSRIAPDALARLLDRIADHTISGKIAKEVLEAMWAGEGGADEVIEARGLRQITDADAILEIIRRVVDEHPAQAADYRAGKDKLLGFFVGQVMKATRGQANPAEVNRLLKEHLG